MWLYVLSILLVDPDAERIFLCLNVWLCRLFSLSEKGKYKEMGHISPWDSEWSGVEELIRDSLC